MSFVSSLLICSLLYGLARSIPPTITNTSGEYYIISDGTFANETITCSNSNNSSSNCHVLCRDSSSCMNFEIIALGAQSLQVECTAESACAYSSITCPNTTNSFCTISCKAKHSCEESVIELHDTDSFNLLCSDTESCSRLDISPTDTIETQTISMQCTGVGSCQNMTWGGDIRSQSMNVSCIMPQSCQFITWSKNIHLNTLDLKCTAYKSCQHMYLDSMSIDTSLNVLCGSNLACQDMQAEFVSTQADENVILCMTKNGQTIAKSGSCYNSRFTFESTQTHTHEGTITVKCNAFDCQGVWIEIDYGYPMAQLSVECNDDYSCSNAWFNGDAVDHVDLYCKGKESCHNTSISCPAESVNDCEIRCVGGDYVCSSMHVWTPYKYTEGAVNLSCDSTKMYAKPCDALQFECDSYYDYETRTLLSKNKTHVGYSNATQEYGGCVVDSDAISSVYCCPIVSKQKTSKGEKEEKWFWFVMVASGAVIVILIVIVCLVRSTRTKVKDSPALLEEAVGNISVVEIDYDEVEIDYKQATYAPPDVDDTEMATTAN